MGLFDFLGLGGEDAQIKRHTGRLTNRDSQPDDREASARWLAQNGSPRALMGLLMRFDLSLEHQLKDAGEKEFVYSLLVGMGAKAVEPTKAWLRQGKQFALPLRLLADLEGQEAAVGMAYELLEAELKKDDFKPDKKKGLLIWLADVRHDGAAAAAAPFLKDFDEGVRYAAAQVMIAQGGEGVRGQLLDVLADPREESNRLKVRIAEGFVQRGWRVDEAAGKLEGRLPPGFVARDGRIQPA